MAVWGSGGNNTKEGSQMILKLRQRMAQEESGFTLVELLVVMLILGLLAAIAIPAFFNQRDKAKDSSAKEAVRTAETAMETFATDHGGSYNGAGPGDLVNIESTLSNVYDPTATPPVTNLSVAEPSGTTGDTADKSYKVTVTSDTGNTFSITRHDDGTTDLTCATGGSAGCPSGGDWSSG
jgi:type IV pilus assembly protein PilA